MLAFQFTAKDRWGNRVSGRLVARSRANALRELRALGYRPDTVWQTVPTPKSTGSLLLFADSLFYPLVADARLKQILRFYLEFAALIQSGIPIDQAIRHLMRQESYRRLRQALHACRRQIEAGGRLSDSFAAFPTIFPAVHVAMLRAAEQGGTLEEALRHIIAFLEQELRVRRFLNAQTLYAKFVFVIGLFGIPLLLGALLGASASTLLRGSLTTLLSLLPTALTLGLLLALARTALLVSEPAALVYDRIKWDLPLLGPVTRKMAWAKFGRTFGALYEAGVAPGTAVTLALEASGSHVLAACSADFARDLYAGLPLSVPFRRCGRFPEVLLNHLVTGETAGDIDALMRSIANYLVAEGETRALQCSWLLAQVFFLLVACYLVSR